jgi:ferritin-like metal-binding protein YciE
MKMKSLQDVFVDQLQDIYDAEKRIVRALPKMAEAAGNQQLREGFLQHLEQTRHHVERLEQAFQNVGAKARAKTCAAMKGLLEEGEEVIDMNAEADVRDAGLIAAAQKVEHYEMAAYGCLCTWADQLGHENVRNLLHETLEEEKQTDAKLTELAEQHVNAHAAMGTSM